jgi:hypothetical protein
MQREADRACALGLVRLVPALEPVSNGRVGTPSPEIAGKLPQRGNPNAPVSTTERAAAGSAPPGSGTTNSMKMYVAAALIKLIAGNASPR